MITRLMTRTGAAAAMTAALLLIAGVAGTRLAAQTGRPVTKFTATTVNLAAGGNNAIRIDVSTWSADADRDKLAAAFQQGPQPAADLLRTLPTAGYFWTGTDGVGYLVRYAYRSPLPGGGERVILATDRPVGSWERGGWRATAPGSTPEYPFTLIELRLNRRGTGDGKMSLATSIAVDPGIKGLALSGYEAAPILLRDVRREGPPAASRPSPGQ
jgi:hypothetical protein